MFNILIFNKETLLLFITSYFYTHEKITPILKYFFKSIEDKQI